MYLLSQTLRLDFFVNCNKNLLYVLVCLIDEMQLL